MLVIALDTSTPAVTAGLVRLGERPVSLADRVTVNARAHGELLAPHVREVLAEAGCGLADVDAIVVGAGPGPFTGLRAGMVTAGSLGHAADKPVHPVCGLDAIAAQIADDAPALVVTDARRREVYWAAYEAGTRARTTGPHVQRPDDVAASELGIRIGGGEKAELVAGIESVGPQHPSPVGLVEAARSELLADAEPAPLVPLYLRRPDAQAPGPPKPVSPGAEPVRGRS